jgi:hypothetical protein
MQSTCVRRRGNHRRRESRLVQRLLARSPRGIRPEPDRVRSSPVRESRDRFYNLGGRKSPSGHCSRDGHTTLDHPNSLGGHTNRGTKVLRR